MIRVIEGMAVLVPDDERITPELIEMRHHLNNLLRYLESPEAKKVTEQFLTGKISEIDGFDWYCDPSKP